MCSMFEIFQPILLRVHVDVWTVARDDEGRTKINVLSILATPHAVKSRHHEYLYLSNLATPCKSRMVVVCSFCFRCHCNHRNYLFAHLFLFCVSIHVTAVTKNELECNSCFDSKLDRAHSCFASLPLVSAECNLHAMNGNATAAIVEDAQCVDCMCSTIPLVLCDPAGGGAGGFVILCEWHY